MRIAPFGGVAEWSKATVLKTVDLQGSVGSNPTASALFVEVVLFESGDVTEWLKVRDC